MHDGDAPGSGGRVGVQAPKKQTFSQANIDLGQRILRLRTEVLNFEEQKEFAAALGVTRGAVGNWELGRGVSRDSLQLIEDRFGVSHEWLTTGAGTPLVEDSIDRRIARRLPPEERQQFYHDVEAMLEARVTWLLGQRKDKKG
jgi:transcriptional regulator with XRE-family HTH domain